MNLLCWRLGFSEFAMQELNSNAGVPHSTSRSGPSAPASRFTGGRDRSPPSITPSSSTPRS